MALQVGTNFSDLQNGIRTHQDHNVAANLDLSNMSINRSTVILSSIGSISKMKALQRSVSDPGSSSLLPLAGFSTLFPPSAPPSFSSTPSKSLPPTSRSRRKSVLLDDNSSDECNSRGGLVEDDRRARGKKRRRLSTLSKRRRRPRRLRLPPRLKHQDSDVVEEPCAFLRCRLPQQDSVQWIQCDVCDTWYHLDCLHISPKKLLMEPNADFHCGCR